MNDPMNDPMNDAMHGAGKGARDPVEGGLSLEEAVAFVREGGLLAFPTETVWGLGADASSTAGVERLLRWKGRGSDQPLSVLVPDIDRAVALGARITPDARRLAGAFWPGPLTLVVPSDTRLAPGVTRADGALGLRCSPHPVAGALARALLQAGCGPLTATSLNRTGSPAARDRGQAQSLCAGAAGPRLVAAGEAGGEEASTVVDCTGPRVILLREGAIPAARIDAALDHPCHRPTPGASPP